ncbi:NAD-dependent deacetylase [Pelotomaculum sp. FP]|uniref:Sir2 family NAD-dependent protein deacetylase n=1 Tax=Pelotomaculum sp. FP TaxID=261474 RepID=UPI0011056789|nr:Sir2 family NAD-dependent protein deacetylase [Pelotomaculum sp. FP]TEB16362.1 NAD-dependent deacetylase [Pelotomaculum sp. FP]
MEQRENFAKAAQALKKARTLVVTAGAGMGVDSGQPDFRGDRGFWKAYPMYERLGLSFVDAANPSHFQANPAFGWGFYGHRANLYRQTLPHHGFTLLLNWVSRYQLDCFVVTSVIRINLREPFIPGPHIPLACGALEGLNGINELL